MNRFIGDAEGGSADDPFTRTKEMPTMIDEDEKPLTLSRDDLYELAWSKPLRELAKDFGISDVGLAKRCKRLGIPLPGRGYWARFDAGQRPHRPKLPQRAPKWHDAKALRVAPAHAAHVSVPVENVSERSGEIPNIMQRIENLLVDSTVSIVDALVPVKRTARHHKHPKRADINFATAEKSGFLVPLSVSSEALDRALLLADTILRAAGQLGWSLDDPHLRNPQLAAEKECDDTLSRHGGSTPIETLKDAPHEGCLIVEGEEINFRVEERFREEPRVPTTAELAREKREWGYHAPRKTSIASGKLRVARIDTYQRYGGPERHSWYDRKGRPVESQIKDMMLGFYQLSQSIKQRRAKAEEAARKHAEEERIRKEREARQAANAKLIQQLETDAGAWHRARYLRRYIRVARQSLGKDAPRARLLNTTVPFFEWADQYINQLDPLHAAPRTADYCQERTGYAHSDADRMKQAFARLLGSEWKEAWKLGKDYQQVQPQDEAWRYSYREPSIFELMAKGDEDLNDD